MRRIKKIGSIALERSLYYTDEYLSQGLSAISERTINGGVVVWEQENQISTNDVTAESLKNYPISEAELIAIRDLADSSLGLSHTLTFTDNTTLEVRFKSEDTPLDASPIYEGACYYTVTIKFAKV